MSDIIPGAAYLSQGEHVYIGQPDGKTYRNLHGQLFSRLPGSGTPILLYAPGDEVIRTTQTLWSTGRKQVTKVRIAFKEPRDV